MTTEDRWQAADEIFSVALELPQQERSQFLDRECQDAELRALVDRLLRHAERESNQLPGGAASHVGLEALAEFASESNDESRSSETQDDVWIGKTVGRFRILEEVGRGGMAVVYLAERVDGEFEQRVALKLIKLGIDTEEVLQRFARERQIMATASHPNIARLLDGGSTDDGRPYFVMEHVEGQAIDRYCNERTLHVADRLELFQQVAAAVAYAHRNLVVHRDIKPSNVVVDADGTAKLLDFGIAGYLRRR